MKTFAFCVALGTLAMAAPALVRADALPEKTEAKKDAKKDAKGKGEAKKGDAKGKGEAKKGDKGDAKKDEAKKDDKPAAGGGW
jgi:hypothetical protein